jgi:hypothetical protein
VQTGGGPAAAFFKRFDQDAFVVEGRLKTITELLPEISRELERMPRGQLTAMRGLFDAQASEMMVLLAEGPEELARRLEEAHRTGAVVTDQMAKDAEGVGRAWERAKLGFEAFIRRLKDPVPDWPPPPTKDFWGRDLPSPPPTPSAPEGPFLPGSEGMVQLLIQQAIERREREAAFRGTTAAEALGEEELIGIAWGLWRRLWESVDISDAERGIKLPIGGGATTDDVAAMGLDRVPEDLMDATIVKEYREEQELLRATMVANIDAQRDYAQALAVVEGTVGLVGGAVGLFTQNILSAQKPFEGLRDLVVSGARQMAAALAEAAARAVILKAVLAATGGFGIGGLGATIAGALAGGGSGRVAGGPSQGRMMGSDVARMMMQTGSYDRELRRATLAGSRVSQGV